MIASKAARGHLHEIDLVRVVTALSVVAVHAAWFTLYLETTPLGSHLQNAVIDVLHYTREVFLSVTAFVLIYGYAQRRFSVWTFWRKRGLGVLFPYVFWSVVYVWLGAPHSNLAAWFRTAVVDIVTGTASYQLYFILLSLQFYLVMPAFLPAIERIGRRYPWHTLIGSGVLQLAIFYVDFHYLEAPAFAATPLGQLINGYQASFLPLYQFYVVLGAVAALHVDWLRSFVLRHGRSIVVGMVLALGALMLRFADGVWVEHLNDGYAASVFQPVMAIFSAATALFLYWLGVSWATHRWPNLPQGQRLWSLLADATFGIYLIHPLILSAVLSIALPKLPIALPVAVRVVAVWGLAAGLTSGISIVMLYTPLLSRLVGRPCGLGKAYRSRWSSRPSGHAIANGRQPALNVACIQPSRQLSRVPVRVLEIGTAQRQPFLAGRERSSLSDRIA